MKKDLDTVPESQEATPSYEAPRVETVLTPEKLEREVHYAGANAVSNAVAA